jgi:hypothetical protein
MAQHLFARRPAPKFMEVLRAACAAENVPLLGAVVVPAPGAYNLGVMLDDSFADHENFVTRLTMALMPAKFERCDGDPLLVQGEFTMHLEE